MTPDDADGYAGPPSYAGGRPPGQLLPPWRPWSAVHGYPASPYPAPPYPAPAAPWQQPWQPQWQPAGWGPPPAAPVRAKRPASVITAAVLAFVSATLVLLATVAAVVVDTTFTALNGPSIGIGLGLTSAQVASVALLVAGGTRALGGRRRVLLVAAALQLVIALRWLHLLGRSVSLLLPDWVQVLPWVFGGAAIVIALLTYAAELRGRLRR